ncbi:MAG: hypothetical protein M3R65_00375 [Gemmatimonadota bacterium]|nr:hypothetical protein [Gemmatimonadota bacterium]
MARGAGGRIGRLVDLNTSYSPFGGVTSYLSTNAYESSPFAASTPPTSHDLTVVATVSARWEIEMPAPRAP